MRGSSPYAPAVLASLMITVSVLAADVPIIDVETTLPGFNVEKAAEPLCKLSLNRASKVLNTPVDPSVDIESQLEEASPLIYLQSLNGKIDPDGRRSRLVFRRGGKYTTDSPTCPKCQGSTSPASGERNVAYGGQYAVAIYNRLPTLPTIGAFEHQGKKIFVLGYVTRDHVCQSAIMVPEELVIALKR